ncbi:MAG: hypothetical protein ABIP94_08300 [Planctomycetota bacterium]
MNHSDGWMDGWMGGGPWIWLVVGLLLGGLVIALLRKRSRE